MAGGGGALPEPGFLDVPTFTIAAVLACFLLASMAFEKVRSRVSGCQTDTAASSCRRVLWVTVAGSPLPLRPPCLAGRTISSAASALCAQSTHWLIHFLKRRKRNGLAQAVSNLVSELTLVGFIALLLTVLQGPISKICGEQELPAVYRMNKGDGRCSEEAAGARGVAGVFCSSPTCFVLLA